MKQPIKLLYVDSNHLSFPFKKVIYRLKMEVGTATRCAACFSNCAERRAKQTVAPLSAFSKTNLLNRVNLDQMQAGRLP